MVFFTRNKVILVGNVAVRKNIFLFIFLLSTQVGAQIKIYEDTDNTGVNKLERIGIIEKYLIGLSQSLKSMEAKLETNTLKLKTIEENLGSIKDKDLKSIMAQLSEKTAAAAAPSKDAAEIEKIKADIMTMKNDDIEKIKLDLQALSSAIKELDK
jgi:hypothetical protein